MKTELALAVLLGGMVVALAGAVASADGPTSGVIGIDGATIVTSWGARCDDVTDDRAAFKAAVSDPRVAKVIVPAATCRLSLPLEIIRDKPVAIAGTSEAYSILHFAADTDGIINGPIADGGSGMVRITDLQLLGAGRCQTTGWNADGTCRARARAVVLNERITLQRVRITGWSGHGVLGSCDVRRSPPTNCNSTVVEDAQIDRVSGDAIYLHGGDSNAWRITRLSAKTNHGWGVHAYPGSGPTTIVDSFFNSNEAGAITATAPGDRAMVIDPYVESSAGEVGGAIVLGANGYLLGGVVDETKVTGKGIVETRALQGMEVLNKKDPANVVHSNLGAPNASGEFLEWRADADSASKVWDWQYFTSGGFANWYAEVFARVNSNTGILRAGEKSKIKGTAAPPGTVWLPGALYVGTNSAPMRLGQGPTPLPTLDGTWPDGSVWRRTATSSAGAVVIFEAQTISSKRKWVPIARRP